MTRYFVSIRFELPSPIPADKSLPPVPLEGMADSETQGGDLDYVVTFEHCGTDQIGGLEVTVCFEGEGYRWQEWLSGAKVPQPIRAIDGMSAPGMPLEAARIAIKVTELLETLVLEHRSKIHQFLSDLKRWAKVGRAWSDGGDSFVFEPRGYMPEVLLGARSVSGDDPPGLSADHCRRLQLLLDAKEPYWTLWHAGYRAALDARQRHGGEVNRMREAVANLESAVEVAVTRTQGWADDRQYGRGAIDQVPVTDLRSALYALLLTRNLVLHRGQMEYKALRPGEVWRDAGPRNGDRPLTPADCHDFAEAMYQALLWLEANRGVIVAPRR